MSLKPLGSNKTFFFISLIKILQLSSIDYLDSVVHNNRVCESDKDGDGAVAGDISDQGQASLRTLLQAVQDILLPKQHNNTLGLAPDVDNWIKTAKGLSHFRPVSSQDILLPKQYNSWIDLKPDIHLRADYRYTSSVQKTRLKKFEEKNLPFPLLHKIKKKELDKESRNTL